MQIKKTAVLVPLLLPVLFASCATKAVRTPVPPAFDLNSTYIDLQPGWTLRVITPILKSGKYELDTAGEPDQAGGITTVAGDNFMGYEVARYVIVPHRRNGVRIVFRDARLVKGDQTTTQAQPRVPLFQFPRTDKYVRLLYMERASGSDHDMAVLAAKSIDRLSKLTNAVRTDPKEACRSSNDGFCSWIPAGIAVRPEKGSANFESDL